MAHRTSRCASTFPLTVNITDPRFTSVTNINVDIALVHPNDSQLLIRLLPQAKLSGPVDVAFGPNGDLFVASRGTSSVVEYSGATGAFVKVFVPSASGGLNDPEAIDFGPDGNLYVTSTSTNSILEYNGGTGAFIQTYVASGSGGLRRPEGLAFGPDGNLYVSSFSTDSVLEYQGPGKANPGTFVATFVTSGSGGLSQPLKMTFGPDGNLYVASSANNDVMRYSGTTGAPLPAPGDTGAVYAFQGLVSPEGVTFGTDGDLYVSSPVLSTITRFYGPNTTGPGGVPVPGSFLDTFVSTQQGGLNEVHGITFGPGQAGPLFATSFQTNSIMRYSAAPGVPRPAPGQAGANFITPGSGGLSQPQSILFRASDANNFLVASNATDSVLRYDGQTGAFLNAYVPSGGNGLSGPTGVVQDGNGNVYVASSNNSRILKYSGALSGTFIPGYVVSSAVGLVNPTGMVVDSANALYVSSAGTNQILKFDPNGVPMPSAGNAGAVWSTGLSNPQGLAIVTDSNNNSLLLVANAGTNQILSYSVTDGTFQGVYADSTTAPLSNPSNLYFNAADKTLYVTSKGNNRVLRFNVNTHTYMESQVPLNNNPANNGGLSAPPAWPSIRRTAAFMS